MVRNIKPVVIIPARMASSRFPGKPLTDILGFPMIQHVWIRSKLCKSVQEVYIATCDKIIAKVAEKFGAKVIMTSSKHEMCMDRVVEASLKINSDIIVTVQGDEPLIKPFMITKSINVLRKNKDVSMSTLVQKINIEKEIFDPNRVKVVKNKFDDVLYISRETIPSLKKTNKKHIFYKLVNIFTTYKKFLKKYKSLKMSRHEKIESIDLLRILDNAYKLKAQFVPGTLTTIDTPKDKREVINLMRKDKLFLNYKNK